MYQSSSVHILLYVCLVWNHFSYPRGWCECADSSWSVVMICLVTSCFILKGHSSLVSGLLLFPRVSPVWSSSLIVSTCPPLSTGIYSVCLSCPALVRFALRSKLASFQSTAETLRSGVSWSLLASTSSLVRQFDITSATCYTDLHWV